ncbi:tRNA lysidine(34) synthetase TilS [Ihubacter sp. mB4P-1]|uniref:tRNA lysidine(34) synthetase TilS n=1 Tax=Ihubacter sp. mB4P-1 TaxID=3242370 RepID=UPI003C7EA88F
MDVFEKVLALISEYNLIKKHQHIVLGLSGGPDSLCLFHILLQLAEEWDLKIYPVHINHMLRPGAAGEDQAFVEEVCRKAGYPAQVFVYDCNAIAARDHLTSEEAGRKVRYEAFAQTAASLRSKGICADDIRIAVAQNADDQAETILFRVLRGVGTDGLSGMHYSRRDTDGNLIVRPLLDVYKDEIMEYCREHDLHPCVDETNKQPLYTRNRLRLQLFPLLEQEYNANIKDTMIRMGRIAAVDSQYLQQQARAAYLSLRKEQENGKIVFSGTGFRELHPAIGRRVLALAFREAGLNEDVSFSHYQACEDIAVRGGASSGCDLPGGYRFARVYDDLQITAKAFSAGDNGAPEITVCEMSMEEYRKARQNHNRCAAFDYDSLAAEHGEGFLQQLTIRHRMPGDYIAIGGGGRKKLQNLFVDCKIPRDERNQLFVAAVGHEILWILPHRGWSRFSTKYQPGEMTKRVICIEIICET